MMSRSLMMSVQKLNTTWQLSCYTIPDNMSDSSGWGWMEEAGALHLIATCLCDSKDCTWCWRLQMALQLSGGLMLHLPCTWTWRAMWRCYVTQNEICVLALPKAAYQHKMLNTSRTCQSQWWYAIGDLDLELLTSAGIQNIRKWCFPG
jgi:hypothetical protein